MNKKKYPQTMYVYKEETEGFYYCSPEFEQCTIERGKRRIAIYRLEKMAYVKNESTLE